MATKVKKTQVGLFREYLFRGPGPVLSGENAGTGVRLVPRLVPWDGFLAGQQNANG